MDVRTWYDGKLSTRSKYGLITMIIAEKHTNAPVLASIAKLPETIAHIKIYKANRSLGRKIKVISHRKLDPDSVKIMSKPT